MRILYVLKEVIRDGEPIIKLKCPKCGKWLDIDDDQIHGRISIWHDVPECGFHETEDLSHITPLKP